MAASVGKHNKDHLTVTENPYFFLPSQTKSTLMPIIFVDYQAKRIYTIHVIGIVKVAKFPPESAHKNKRLKACASRYNNTNRII
jgi:hypothetical protein